MRGLPCIESGSTGRHPLRCKPQFQCVSSSVSPGLTSEVRLRRVCDDSLRRVVEIRFLVCQIACHPGECSGDEDPDDWHGECCAKRYPIQIAVEPRPRCVHLHLAASSVQWAKRPKRRPKYTTLARRIKLIPASSSFPGAMSDHTSLHAWLNEDADPVMCGPGST